MPSASNWGSQFHLDSPEIADGSVEFGSEDIDDPKARTLAEADGQRVDDVAEGAEAGGCEAVGEGEHGDGKTEEGNEAVGKGGGEQLASRTEQWGLRNKGQQQQDDEEKQGFDGDESQG